MNEYKNLWWLGTRGLQNKASIGHIQLILWKINPAILSTIKATEKNLYRFIRGEIPRRCKYLLENQYSQAHPAFFRLRFVQLRVQVIHKRRKTPGLSLTAPWIREAAPAVYTDSYYLSWSGVMQLCICNHPMAFLSPERSSGRVNTAVIQRTAR